MKSYNLNDRYHVYIFAVLLVLILIYSSGCGFQVGLRTSCTLNVTTCDALFGIDHSKANDILTDRVREIEKEVETIKTVLDGQINSVSLLSNQYSINETLISLLQTSVSNNSDSIQNLVDMNQTLANSISYQNTVINNHQIELNNLASEDPVVEYYDPCGTKPGSFNEVLLKTRSGNFLCYFENGSNRFLTQLSAGSYRTTDGTNCNFTLNANGTVTNEHY
jgi:hypothetical protein